MTRKMGLAKMGLAIRFSVAALFFVLLLSCVNHDTQGTLWYIVTDELEADRPGFSIRDRKKDDTLYLDIR